jgi:hypothetical protein
MFKDLKAWLPVLTALVVATFALGANAACCNVPTSHQIRIPNVVIGQPGASQGCSTGCGGSAGCDTCTPPPSGCNCNVPPTGCQDHCGRRNHNRSRFSGDFSVNASVSASANATANSSANSFANSNAFGLGGAINGSTGFGGGGSSFYLDYNNSYIPSLNVEEASAAAAATIRIPYSATRSVTKVVVLQAVCLDDKAIPHPASQVTPDKQIADSYEGELYRCIAGTRMQFTIADYNGKVSFDHGQTITCKKNDALYHVAGGRGECRVQKPARDCNERSLLRRFGAGIKILKIVWTETYTAYRTEVQKTEASASASASAMGMAIDGGVGGIVH